ncbi:aspartate/glutamate racemase family protein [Falsiruegeria mediterranea]|jgi:aspartate racemase
MHIGLIGGIGPAATAAYYLKLSDRCRAAGVPLDLTIVNTDIQVLARNAQADRRDDQARVYADVITRLAASGAEVAAITSIGGSFCEDETRAMSSLPLISAFGALDDHFANQGIASVGILGTETVMQSHLYGRMEKTRTVVPDGQIAEVGQAYVETALAGRANDAQRDLFFTAGRRMVDEMGADAVVLAGTDLGLAFDGQDPGYPVIDTIDVHVDQLFLLASGALKLQDLSL